LLKSADRVDRSELTARDFHERHGQERAGCLGVAVVEDVLRAPALEFHSLDHYNGSRNNPQAIITFPRRKGARATRPSHAQSPRLRSTAPTSRTVVSRISAAHANAPVDLTPIPDPNSAVPEPSGTHPTHPFCARADRRAEAPTSVNQRVVGSSPTSGATSNPYGVGVCFFQTVMRRALDPTFNGLADECDAKRIVCSLRRDFGGGLTYLRRRGRYRAPFRPVSCISKNRRAVEY
jgi:hypothetical protein